MTRTISVVLPAYNAERTLGDVLRAVGAQEGPPPDEVIVVDDGSTDRTAAIAAGAGARVLTAGRKLLAGGARNRGWAAAQGDLVIFLDADAVPAPGWLAGYRRAAAEYPGTIIGCARSFSASGPWGWVAHLQVETPYLPSGEPREVAFVSSYCMAVPQGLPLRFDESYGGEDAIFCADALARGIKLVFDPRIVAEHRHGRESFGELRSQQRRLAYGLARAGPVQREGTYKRVLSRLPVHYFVLLRLVAMHRRLRNQPELHRRFVALLPRLVVAEWTLGLSACRYVFRRPGVRGDAA